MLEESRMDKNRSIQLQSKATTVDCKKTSDLTHKPWPRNNKKREGSGSAPKSESYRKNVPTQRGRGQIDRRASPRSVVAECPLGGTPNTGLEEHEEPEIGSILVPGSKKQNLNHLLNFMYPSRGNQERPDRRGQQNHRRPTQQRAIHRHEHDLYLRAYCQFVVKEDGDYKVNLQDPDKPIKWEQIEEIIVRSTGRSECPICLGPPVAGRVHLCGHVYCWPCVLHYAAAHDKQPPPCPVCATALQVKDMKPTKMVQWAASSEEVTMRLVRRLRGSNNVEVAPLRGLFKDTEETPILPLEHLGSAPFCKIFTANKQQVHDILKRERLEIERQILAEIDTTEIVYLEQALQLLKLKEDNINAQCEKPKVTEVVEKPVPMIYEKLDVVENKFDWFDVTDEGAACVEIMQDKTKDLILTETNLNPEAAEFNIPDEAQLDENSGSENLLKSGPLDGNTDLTEIDRQNQSKYFYFYQAEDGQQVFLNSLNVRILNASWGALPAAPLIVRGRVLHRETLPLSEQTRKHMPYTAHLPLHCSFDIVELDLQPPYVTTEALESFTDELHRRAKIRARNDRHERRRERAYHRAVEGPPKPDITSDLLFPPATHSFSTTLDPPLAPEQDTPTTSASSPPSGPSFAKMASTSGIWRVRKVNAPPPEPPQTEEEAAGPRALNLSDAIEAALHAKPSASSKKNKKSKPKLLFATGMQRAA